MYDLLIPMFNIMDIAIARSNLIVGNVCKSTPNAMAFENQIIGGLFLLHFIRLSYDFYYKAMVFGA